MAKVHFSPYVAVKYVGLKAKELAISTARPKPKLKKGDIVIVDKRTGFNMVKKGFEQFEDIAEISFVKNDTETALYIEGLEKENEELKKKVLELEALIPSNEEETSDTLNEETE